MRMANDQENAQAAAMDCLLLRMIRACGKAGGGVTVTTSQGAFSAIFDNEYVPQTLGALEVESRGPALTCRTSDVERLGLQKDTELTVRGETYRVRKHEPDGTGLSVLLLRR